MSKFRCILLLLCLSFCFNGESFARQHAHYRFVLPDGYTGWVQLIFNDPAADPLPHDTTAVIFDVPEEGFIRTQSLHIHGLNPDLDEFLYKRVDPTGRKIFMPVPPDLYLRGDMHGGFSVMDTGGKGRGYSWFIFIGPPSLRSKTKNADLVTNGGSVVSNARHSSH